MRGKRGVNSYSTAGCREEAPIVSSGGELKRPLRASPGDCAVHRLTSGAKRWWILEQHRGQSERRSSSKLAATDYISHTRERSFNGHSASGVLLHAGPSSRASSATSSGFDVGQQRCASA